MSEHEKNVLEGALGVHRKHLESHGCSTCMQHFYTVLRAMTIWLETSGKPPVFSGNGDGEKPDTPESAGMKAELAVEIRDKALRIFGGKK